MAGTILISRGVGVALNSIGYDYIIEAIRGEFGERHGGVRSQIYEGYDPTSLSFVSVIEQGAEGFRIFERAARAAYEKAAQAGQTFADWNELLAKLANDPRSKHLGCD